MIFMRPKFFPPSKPLFSPEELKRRQPRRTPIGINIELAIRRRNAMLAPERAKNAEEMRARRIAAKKQRMKNIFFGQGTRNAMALHAKKRAKDLGIVKKALAEVRKRIDAGGTKFASTDALVRFINETWAQDLPQQGFAH